MNGTSSCHRHHSYHIYPTIINVIHKVLIGIDTYKLRTLCMAQVAVFIHGPIVLYSIAV